MDRHASESWYLPVDRGRPRHEMPSFAGPTLCLRRHDEVNLDHDTRLKRLRFRSWHRGTKEADMMIGGYFDTHHARWSAAELDWFEALLEEQDVDIMGWAIGSIPCPARWDGPMMHAMRAVDYVTVAR